MRRCIPIKPRVNVVDRALQVPPLVCELRSGPDPGNPAGRRPLAVWIWGSTNHAVAFLGRSDRCAGLLERHALSVSR